MRGTCGQRREVGRAIRRPVGPGLANVRYEFTKRTPQTTSNLQQAFKAGIALSTLDPADVCAIKAGLEAEGLLGVAALKSQAADSLA